MKKELRDKIDQIAAKEHRTRSHFIVHELEKAIERESLSERNQQHQDQKKDKAS